MLDVKDELQTLLENARGGCSESARVLVEKWAPHFIRVIRGHLNHRVRRLFDSTDFLQEALSVAFERLMQDGTFTDPQRFLAFLTGTIKLKIAEAHRRHLDAQKRDERRLVSLEASGAEWTLADSALGPAEEAELRERLAGPNVLAASP